MQLQIKHNLKAFP